MDISRYQIELTRHALWRSYLREIDLEEIEATVQGGTIERIGKHCLRFRKCYKDGEVICIGKIKGLMISLLTVEKK